MHFHLPKPLHGWREFAGEVGIIVIGVLIALGAEQVVEAIHWRQTVAQEREALDRDVTSIWTALSARVVIQRCVDNRLADLSLVFDRHARGHPLGIFDAIGRPTVWSASTGALQMASADQSLAHMPLKAKAAYFDVQSTYEQFIHSAQEERDSWRVLQLLDAPATLSEEDWRELKHAYRNAADSNEVLKFNLVFGTSGQWLTPFEAFPRMPPNREALTVPKVRELCRPAVKR